jgi:hypothetical protein
VLGRTRPRRRARLGVAALMIAVLAAIGFAVIASNSRNGSGPSQTAARAATLHRIANGDRGNRQSWRLLPATAGAFGDVTRLVAMAVAAFEAARAPAPTVSPPHRLAARRRPHPPRRDRTRSRGKTKVEPPPSEGREGEAPSSEGEPEVPISGGQAEAPPVETAPAEAPPPPPSTSGAPAP